MTYSHGYAGPGTVVPGTPRPAGNDKPMKKIENGGKDKDKDKDKGDKNDKDEVSQPATVVISAPRDVTVTFNGQVTNRTSEVESFQTPNLTPGRSYAYQVKAEAVRDGKKVTRSKRVLVRAGGRSRVDFTDMDTVAASTETSDSARVLVLLPEGSRLYVDGKAYGTSARQTFTTPKLEKGKVYYYTVKSERMEDNKADTRRVNVEAGKDVTVDFRDRNVVSAGR
jgi:uncharacterized protein (TIGR03000 family)